jgi:hypothetical protein
MTFFYKDNAGTAYVFSGNNLKRDLLLLQSEEETISPSLLIENNSLTSNTIDTENLKSLYAKLNFEVVEITNEDLLAKFSQALTPGNLDLFSSIFSLNKTHFRAVVYLLYIDQINVNYIQILLDADAFTRNKLLISKFPDYQNNNMLVLNLTENILGNYFSNNNQFESMRVTESKEFFILDAAVSIFPEQYYLLKNIFFNVSFQNVIWDKNNFNQKDVSRNTKYTSYVLLLPGQTESTTYIKEIITTANGAFYTYYRSLLEAQIDQLYRSRSSNSRINEPRQISSENFISYILNSHFMEFSRKSSLGRLNNGRSARIRENNKKIFVENGLKIASSYALSDNGAKPTLLSIFHHLYFMYNTANYSTLEDFNFVNIGGSFNITDDSMYDFSYITDVPFRNFLNNKLFPSFSLNEKKLPAYAYRYFLNRSIFDTSSFSSSARTSPFTQSYIKIRSRFIENLYKNTTIINNDRIVEKIGGPDIKAYFEKALSLAIQDIEADETFLYSLNVLNYASFNLNGTIKAVESLNGIRDEIIERINSQTVNTNQFINDVTLIYRTFLVDLVTSYFGFLTEPLGTVSNVTTFTVNQRIRIISLGTSTTQFYWNKLFRTTGVVYGVGSEGVVISPLSDSTDPLLTHDGTASLKNTFKYEISTENLKLYKLLNFIKHIFISLYPFTILAKESKPLLDFYTLMLSIKGLLTEAEIKGILNKTYSEIEQLFRR